VKVNVINMETADGMAEAAFYELLHKHTPILVVDDEVFEGAIKIVEKITACGGNGK
jgi:deoxyxylulose-5-phosphate synthase